MNLCEVKLQNGVSDNTLLRCALYIGNSVCLYFGTFDNLVANFLCERRPYRDSRLCLTQDVRGAYVPSLFSRQCFLRNGAVQRAVLAVVPNTGCQRCLGALFVLKARFLTKRGRVENRVGSSAKHKMSEVLRCPLCS